MRPRREGRKKKRRTDKKPDREGESEAVDFVQKFSHSLLVDWMGNPETSFYAGCPVVVEKKTLGSFCIIGKAPH